MECTKNDEYQSAPCNCPQCLEERAGRVASLSAPTVVTDENILNEGKFHTWTGPVFSCPECGEPGIMPPGVCCAHCGKRVEYRSKILTEIIKNLQN